MASSSGQHPHIGGAEGQSSRHSADTSALHDERDPASGEIEIPIGTPISSEEFRRLQRDAQRSNRDSDAPTDAQEDQDAEDPGPDDPEPEITEDLE
ncbi:MAG: hypothetical protein ACOH2F_08895 [Cellulomonas sp.]